MFQGLLCRHSVGYDLTKDIMILNFGTPFIYDIETVVLYCCLSCFSGWVFLPCDHGLDLWDQPMWKFNQLLIDWLNPHISWSQRSSPWSHKCSGAQRKTAQINTVYTTMKNMLKLNTTHTRISIRLLHHVHSCPFPVQLKITAEISRYIQRNTHNRGNKQQ